MIAVKKIILLFVLCQMAIAAAFAQLTVQHLLVENRSNPVGLDVMTPRFSWQLNSNQRNVMQTAYEVKITANERVVWQSGKVASDSSVHVVYKGEPLQSGIKYNWQVRVWDNQGNASKWSETSFFQNRFAQ